MLEETFQILHGLMTEEVFDFKGKYRTITSARFEPKPVQSPGRRSSSVARSPPNHSLGGSLGRPVELPGFHLRAGPVRRLAETSRRGL